MEEWNAINEEIVNRNDHIGMPCNDSRWEHDVGLVGVSNRRTASSSSLNGGFETTVDGDGTIDVGWGDGAVSKIVG